MSIRCLLCALAFAAVVTGTSISAGPLPAESYSKAIAADLEHLNALVELQKASPTNKSILAHIKATAMLLAYEAQLNFDGKDADKMAALRAQALKVAEAVAKKDAEGAIKAIGGLKDVAPDAKADKSPLKPHTLHKVDLREMMNLFGKPRNGGMNMEADLRAMKKDGVKDAKQAEVLGTRTVGIAEFAAELPPQFNAKQPKEDWERWTKDMKDSATELTKEAQKGSKADMAKLKKTASALDASCVNCHRVFRVDP